MTLSHEALAVFSTEHAHRASGLSPALLPQLKTKYHSERPVVQGWREFSRCSFRNSSQAFLSLCHANYPSLKFGLPSRVSVKATVLFTPKLGSLPGLLSYTDITQLLPLTYFLFVHNS